VRTSRIVVAALILCSGWALAQSVEVHGKPLTDTEIKLLRQDLQTAKNDIIADTMQFTTNEAAAFWPVYREYSSEQHAIAERRLSLVTEYAQKLDKMDDATANSMTERLFQIEDDTQALRKKYFPRFKQALGAKRAAKFYQVDNRLTMMTDLQLATEIPLIP
jgi:transketolase